MIFRADDVQVARRKRSMHLIEHIITSGKASYKYDMLCQMPRLERLLNVRTYKADTHRNTFVCGPPLVQHGVGDTIDGRLEEHCNIRPTYHVGWLYVNYRQCNNRENEP